MDLAELRQVNVPTQYHSHPVGDRQVKFIRSNREREADYHHHIKPHIVLSDPSRTPGTLYNSSRDLQDVVHDPRILYISSQHEKVLPSVEERFRPLNYRRISNDFVKQSFKPAPESTISTCRDERNPRIINLGEAEVHATKHRRVDDLVILSPETFSQPFRNNHQERDYGISRKHDNEWHGSRQNHMATVHQSFSDSSLSEDTSKLAHRTDARSYSDMQRPAQMLQTRMNVAGQQPHIMNDGRERPSHHERVEVSFVAPSSLEQPQAFLNTAHNPINFSQSFPTVQRSHKQLPVFLGPLRPHVTSDRDGVQLRREPANSSGPVVSTSNPTGFDEYGQEMQSDLASLSIRPEYRRHHVEDDHGGFDTNQKTYLTPQGDPREVHIDERPRTGIFLREVGSARQSIPEGSIYRPIEIQSRPLRKMRSGQHSNPEPSHGVFEGQKKMSAPELSRKPIMELSRPDNFHRYVSGNDPSCHIRLL